MLLLQLLLINNVDRTSLVALCVRTDLHDSNLDQHLSVSSLRLEEQRRFVPENPQCSLHKACHVKLHISNSNFCENDVASVWKDSNS